MLRRSLALASRSTASESLFGTWPFVVSAFAYLSWRSIRLTLRVKLCGRGPRAEADAARRLPHVSRRAAGGVPPPALVS